MTIANKLRKLDGRHKLAIVMAIGAWAVSIYFSRVGFSIDNPKAGWLGWFLGVLVTTVELVFNSKTHKLSMTLIGVGILCYMYGIWTNVSGFYTFQHETQFVWNDVNSIMSWFVGLVLEVLPEPLFMWGIGAELDGDLVGNLVGLWSGELEHATPNNNKPQSSQVGQRKPAFEHSSEIFSRQFPATNQHKGGGSQRREQLEKSRGQNNKKPFHNYHGE